MNQHIEEFGKALVLHVRDRAIRGCDRSLQPDSTARRDSRWKELAEGLAPAAQHLIPDIVDATLMELLAAIDQGILGLVFITEAGTPIDLSEKGSGELAGWYSGLAPFVLRGEICGRLR